MFIKKILLLLLGCAFTLNIFTNPVNPVLALKIAKNFYIQKAKDKSLSEVSFSLAYIAKSNEIANQKETIQETALLYIFNVEQSDGFVIISADDNITPILGYSLSGSYFDSNLPPAFIKLIEKYKKEITDVLINGYKADLFIENEWKSLEGGYPINTDKETMSVYPLLTTTWSQSPYVNALCPYDVDAGSANGYHCVAGCPATAMAQIMKFWNYPTTGTGFHSYNHDQYGTLSANFAATTYDWSSMPNNINGANTAVATIMYHCGVAVEMGYGPTSSGSYVIISGSPTPEQCSEYAFKTYFGYDPTTLQGLKRDNYSDSNWINILKTDLNARRPIQYAGFGQGGHTFVCDGYDNNDYFHMNWGWGGYCDGFFTLDALNPGTGGTGAGAGTYNEGQQALIGIQPVPGSVISTINLFSSISISPNPVNFAQSFTVNVDVTNAGTNNFSGDYCAALFTASGNFIDYIQILSAGSSPLQPGYHYTNGLTFSNSGILTVPDNYKVGIFYRDPNENWTLAGNSSYTNPINVTINSPANNIQLYSAIDPSTFVQGQSASVNFNLINGSTTTYYGSYRANLYDLEGNFVQTIGTINETNGLPEGYIYSSPFITVSTPSVIATPGTYILTIEELQNGSSNWYLVGGQYYSNPINITVVSPSLSPDIYEDNNNEGSAYNLPLSFSGGTATKTTIGSNIHINSDLDYYKIILPAGYNYSINARIHDSYNSGNGQTYTADVMFSYKNNSGWSDNFDDIMTSNISVINGGTVIFNVAPYFTGETGSYLLDISVTRNVGINEIEDISNSISLFPNPANNIVNIDINNCIEKVNTIKIFDNIGKEINSYSLSEFSGTIYPLSTSEYSNGLYFIDIISDKFVINKKLIIQK